MKYRFTYEKASGQVLYAEEINTATIDSDDTTLFNDVNNGVCRAKVVSGALKRDTTEVAVEENVVPTDRLADALEVARKVGMGKPDIQELAASKKITLTEDSSDISD